VDACPDTYRDGSSLRIPRAWQQFLYSWMVARFVLNFQIQKEITQVTSLSDDPLYETFEKRSLLPNLGVRLKF
jgi:hypothetical protein